MLKLSAAGGRWNCEGIRRREDLGATIYHALNVPTETRLGRDGFTRPVSTGQPILELFG